LQRASPILRQPIFWILLLAFFHGAWYAAIVHPWQAPDEYLHYQWVRLMDATRSVAITPQDMSSTIQWEVADTMWVFEHHRYRLLPTPPESLYRSLPMPLGPYYNTQAPLHYLLSLPIYWATSSWPVVAQLYVLRLFSVILHVATVWLTYKLAKLIFQGPPSRGQVSQTIALSSAGVVALLPQYTFISASFNNDNMTSPLVAATLFAMYKSVQEQGRLRWLLLASILAILAVTAKRTAIGIVPLMGLVVIACGLLWWRSGRPVLRVAGALIVGLPVVGLVGLVLILTNPAPIPAQLAGMLRLGTGALLQLAGYLNDPIQRVNRLDWSSWSHFVLESFWGQFAWLTIRLDPLVIDATEWVTKFMMTGCILGALRAFRSWRSPGSGLRAFALSTMALGLLITGALMAAQYVLEPIYYSPQARYLFPFISAFGILAIWGWRSWWPGKWQDPATLLGLGLLVLLDVISSATIISYFYS
jgi:4-amino-4-deoxy-L-arabinose transferase-like glycosyltransferase